MPGEYQNVARTAAANHVLVGGGETVGTLQVTQNNGNTVRVEGRMPHHQTEFNALVRSEDPQGVNMPIYGSVNTSYVRTTRAGEGRVVVDNAYPHLEEAFETGYAHIDLTNDAYVRANPHHFPEGRIIPPGGEFVATSAQTATFHPGQGATPMNIILPSGAQIEGGRLTGVDWDNNPPQIDFS